MHHNSYMYISQTHKYSVKRRRGGYSTNTSDKIQNVVSSYDVGPKPLGTSNPWHRWVVRIKTKAIRSGQDGVASVGTPDQDYGESVCKKKKKKKRATHGKCTIIITIHFTSSEDRK